MADATSITSTVVAASTAGLVTGRTPSEIVLWSLLGALVAVYLERDKVDRISMRWVFSAIGMIFSSVLSGIVGSALIVALVAGWEMAAPLTRVDRWVYAFCVAALIHKAAPLAFAFLKRRVNSTTQGDRNAAG